MQNMEILVISVALASTMFVAAGVAAEMAEQKAPQGENFSNYDLNRDGVISRTEAATEPQLRQTWVQLDEDSDDQLNQAEFARLELSADAADE